jgi:hypothetical protein
MNLACEVLVVGAGVAGAPAAVAAARAGADTLLVEKRAFPGGAGVVGLHRHICGLFANPAAVPQLPAGKPPCGVPLNGGLVLEICDRLRVLAPGRRPIRIGKVDVLPYSPSHYRSVLGDLLSAESRLRVLWNTEVRGAKLEGHRVSEIRVALPGGKSASIVQKAVVDASGDGVVIRSSPLLHEPPAADRQLAGYTVRLAGMADGDDLLSIKVPYLVRREAEAGRLPSVLRFLTYAGGDDPGDGWLKMSFPTGTTAVEAVAQSRRLLDCLKAAMPAFRNAAIADLTSEVLEREGPRLKGLHTLTVEDVLAGRSFPDAAARGAWPIETWDPVRGPVYRYLGDGIASYDIPARCLKAAAARNCYAAGRCISATPAALGSTRVMGTCMALGEAVGRAAAGPTGPLVLNSSVF